ncbi:hypothetical protein [Herbiconiux sp. A18JL235]|uniref:Lipoprotein n=1 Tax=Herbiconiux sp. A18JL235 TaxID=3152363 RepID=A0AB39BGJ3_9MICO
MKLMHRAAGFAVVLAAVGGVAGCAVGAPASAPSAPPVSATTREDAVFAREMLATGWTHDSSGLYFRAVDAAACTGSCTVDIETPAGCPSGVKAGTTQGSVIVTTSALQPGVVTRARVTVPLVFPQLETRIISASCI